MAELRLCLKNTKFYLLDDLWNNNEYEKKAIVSIIKDFKLMQILNIDPATDEVA